LISKKAIFDFLSQQQWTKQLTGVTQRATSKNFYVKGIRFELKRIAKQLNEFCEKVLYTDPLFPMISTLNDKSLINQDTIIKQDDESIQGRCTWGPRNNDSYDEAAFELVCKHRDVHPVPKPTREEGNFDEAYMLFLNEIAQRLDIHFQSSVSSLKSQSPVLQNAVHYAVPVKPIDRCYSLMKNDLVTHNMPRAARILDYCRCIVAFPNIKSIMDSLKVIQQNFRICKVVNTFSDNKKMNSSENIKYLDCYIISQHPSNRFIKLICEIRLTLQRIRDLSSEYKFITDCFIQNEILTVKEIQTIMKEASVDFKGKNKNPNAKKAAKKKKGKKKHK